MSEPTDAAGPTEAQAATPSVHEGATSPAGRAPTSPPRGWRLREQLRELVSWSRRSTVPGGLLFYGWTGLFTVVTLTTFGPTLFAELLQAAWHDELPIDMALTGIAILLVPPASLLASRLRDKADPRWLPTFLYGVTLPLFFFLLARLFLIRELTPGTWHLLLCAELGVASLIVELLFGLPSRSRLGAVAHLVGHALLAVVGVYLAMILLFFVVPAAHAFLDELLDLGWVGRLARDLVREPFSVLGALLLGGSLIAVTATLFIALPPAMVFIYLRSARRAVAELGDLVPTPLGIGIVVAVAAANVGLFVVVNEQPQGHAFQSLAVAPSSVDERAQLLEDRETLRAGLTNAYLAPYRYQGAAGEISIIQKMYRHEFDASTAVTDELTAWFRSLARPFVYDGASMRKDSKWAAELYPIFFDQPIQGGEHNAVRSAITATHDRSTREAGLLDVDQKLVHVARQDLEVTTDGDLAEIVIHEEYRNQTHDQQEVLYLFSLPEAAAVTGLWLGDTDDREKAFPFSVSTRGAAQEVYKAIVRQRQDPALLEQVGPRQYRLRAFPIPPRARRSGELAPPMHLWLRIVVPLEGGAFPLPRLREVRNAYFDSETVRDLGGADLEDAGDWLPSALPAHNATPRSHRVRLATGDVVQATPLPKSIVLQPSNRRIAVVVDRSYSMRRVEDELEAAVAALLELTADNTIDFYLSAAPGRGEPATRLLDPAALPAGATLPYGGHSAADLLRQLDELSAGDTYDGAVLLTDDGSYDQADDRDVKLTFAAPLTVVHLGGRLAKAYDDETLEALQQRGGVAVTRLADALDRIERLARERGEGASARQMLPAGGYAFALIDDDGSAETGGIFAAVAARQLLQHRVRSADLDDVGTLDALHQLAQKHPMASPYSSLLVLVNDQQREMLRLAELQSDRFEREVESGMEVLSKSSALFGAGAVAASAPGLTGTPEPHEWALLAVAALALLVVARRRRGERTVSAAWS